MPKSKTKKTKQTKKFFLKTKKYKGGSREEIRSLFPDGGYANFNWGMYYLSAHGLLSQEMFQVPENTYILNISPTGTSCIGLAWDIERLIYSDNDTKESLEAQRKIIYNKLVEGITKDFTATNRETIYKKGNLRQNIEEIFNSGTKEGKKTIAFYEPGDYMFDTLLFFRNHAYPLFLIGLYEMPIKQSIWSKVIDINEPIWKNSKRPDAQTFDEDDIEPSATIQIPAGKSIQYMYDKADEVFNIPENLAKDAMFPDEKLIQDPNTYNTHLMLGVATKNIPISFYPPQQQTLSLLTRSPPADKPSLRNHPSTAPYLRAGISGKRVPSLYDVTRHLNSIDSRTKLIIVHTCRAIWESVAKDFTPKIARRLSIATRERKFYTPEEIAAASATSATTASTSATTATTASTPAKNTCIMSTPTTFDENRLRSQLRRKYIISLKDSIERRKKIEQAKTPKNTGLIANLENGLLSMQNLLKKEIFDFRELYNVLKFVCDKKLVGLQAPFVKLLQLNTGLPAKSTVSYQNKLKTFEDEYAQRQLSALSAMQAASRASKKVKKLNSPSEEQTQAIYNFMGQLADITYRRFAETPADMETVYWTWVEAYLNDPSKPIPGTGFFLTDVLKSVNHAELDKAGIDVTPEGLVKK